uniref:IP20141p n=1 Tax=Drosophila melanogaster TaxID=7227 RepID=A8E729_DROME|nr:IP20141p [Drosophila melanogaster]
MEPSGVASSASKMARMMLSFVS